MAVQDVTTLANVIYVYNSDVADSVTFASKYCNEYGIPNNANNRLALALGTAANQRAYDAEATIYGLIEDIADAAIAVDANGVIVGAGCPAAFKLLTDNSTTDGSNDGGAFDFVHLAGAAKYIKTLGYAPRVISDEQGGYHLRRKQAGAWTAGADLFTSMQTLTYNATNFSAAFEAVENADYAAAIASDVGQEHGSYNSWTQYKTGWDGDFSQYNFLPCGFAGYWSFEETTHPVDLNTKSLAIVNRAIASAGRRSALLTRKILCGLGNYGGTRTELGQSARWSTVAKRFDDLGFDVEYFYNDTSDPAGDYLMPWANIKTDWSPTTLDDATAPGSVSYAIAFGPAFKNGCEAGGTGADWQGAADNIRTTANGLFIGGASGNGRWVKANQTEGGHSGFAMQNEVGGNHSNASNCLARLTDATMALLDGHTLIEAGFVGYRGGFYPVGDPLLRPFRV